MRGVIRKVYGQIPSVLRGQRMEEGGKTYPCWEPGRQRESSRSFSSRQRPRCSGGAWRMYLTEDYFERCCLKDGSGAGSELPLKDHPSLALIRCLSALVS